MTAMTTSDSLEDLLDNNSSSRELSRLASALMRQSTIEVQGLPPQTLEKCIKALDSGLDQLDPHKDPFIHCLSALHRVCGIRGVLPKSHIYSCAHLDVSKEVIVPGFGADIHEGTSDYTKVHVKKLRDYAQGDTKNPELFYHEVVLRKRIHHPNIVPFHGATLTPRQQVLDRMEHGCLMDFLSKHPKANRLGLLNDVAEGLNYLHCHNVIVGSIKGPDIFVDQHRRARITDFAFATIGSDQGAPRTAKELCNSLPPRWTAPEVIDGRKPLNKKADIYSFAMLMIQVFTGKIPFDNLRTFQLPVEIDYGTRPERPKNLTDDVWDLIARCWRQEADKRPEIAEVLQIITQGLLRSLHQFIESPLELQVALNQFYDSTGRMSCIEHLDKAKLRCFVNFLDEMLHNEGLIEDIRQRTLHYLREVCKTRTVLPDSCLVLRQISKVSDKPHAESEYVEVWEGRAVPEEGSGSTMDICIKVLKSKDVKRFYGEVAVWTKLEHRNIVRCFGMAVDRPKIVTEWMPNGQAITYAQGHNATDRVSLLIDIAHGLEYLHSRGVIHGNLKHENILLDSKSNARLCDIGFAALVPADESGFDLAPVNASGCRWVAPEVFQKGKLTEQSDVFSYGFIAAEIFLGKFLWDTSDKTEVKSRISNGERPIRSEHGESQASTVDLWRMFATCWGADPRGRISIPEALGVLTHIPLKISYILKQASDPRNDNYDAQERINELDKILGAGMVSHKERPVIVNRLCKLCDESRKLPGSMLVAYESLQAQSAAVDRGGFGDVYQGKYDKGDVAIKVMRFYLCYDRDLFLSKFCREAIMWRHLRHPNILPLLAATFEDQEPKVAMVSRWMTNGNINSFVKENDVNRVRLLVDVAHGLQYLHSFNFVHGDLKGANVLINDDRRACLADFGLSTIASLVPRVSNDATAGTSAIPESSLVHHSPGGTEQWMSPELLDPVHFGCDSRPTVQSDCYALGMVIYEVLCGKEPYGGQKLGRLVSNAIINDVRPNEPDDKARLGFTDGLWWAVMCCWLKDRDMRPDVKTILSRLDYAAWAWDMRRSPRIPS